MTRGFEIWTQNLNRRTFDPLFGQKNGLKLAKFCESVRARAIGMVEGGYSQRDVGECLSLIQRTCN